MGSLKLKFLVPLSIVPNRGFEILFQWQFRDRSKGWNKVDSCFYEDFGNYRNAVPCKDNLTVQKLVESEIICAIFAL